MRGYHKPIMIAGGLGTIDAGLTKKIEFPAGTLLIQLGGPGMRIGMGGGAASLDGHRRQRGRTRLRFGAARQPRDRAAGPGGHQPLLGRGRGNPILAIHDVGAGGLSNAFPELTQRRRPRGPVRPAEGAAGGVRPGAARRSGATRARSAMCWRSRRRSLEQFKAFCERERCPFAVVGVATRRAAAGGGRRTRQPTAKPRRSTCR